MIGMNTAARDSASARCTEYEKSHQVPMNRFDRLIALLRRRYGQPALPPARGPFELVLWENACYLLPDERRAAVFDGLRAAVGLDPYRILPAGRGVLLGLAKMGGMRPETRVFRWLKSARLTVEQFGG